MSIDESFYKVSAVRMDGGAHETTFIGYGAEGCAFQYARSLEGPYVRYCAVVRRYYEGPNKVRWELEKEWQAPPAQGPVDGEVS